MPPLDTGSDAFLLALRFGALFVLYGFLLSVFLLVRRELQAQGRPRASVPGHLVVVEGGDTGLPPGHTLPLEQVTTLGRAPDCTLVLGDTFVSSTHALLTWRDGRWWLRDAGSTNGTLLNQQPLVDGEIPIDYGDVVGVGRLQLKLTP
jgi:Inner membrane component of T3SS, cytoplasmic domain